MLDDVRPHRRPPGSTGHRVARGAVLERLALDAVRDDVARLRVPTLWLVGGDDPTVPPEIIRTMKQDPTARVEINTNGGLLDERRAFYAYDDVAVIVLEILVVVVLIEVFSNFLRRRLV